MTPDVGKSTSEVNLFNGTTHPLPTRRQLYPTIPVNRQQIVQGDCERAHHCRLVAPAFDQQADEDRCEQPTQDGDDEAVD
ncbi:MAG TPA: hypothetical protein VLA49_02350 [Anaerolineales bacterium]|nr:hypothetical protein [Anaerolineales bacterium]